MSLYQGHLPDGSSIQRHSAGGLYPFVIVARDSIDALDKHLMYGVLRPGQLDPDCWHAGPSGYDRAIERAELLKYGRRSS